MRVLPLRCLRTGSYQLDRSAGDAEHVAYREGGQAAEFAGGTCGGSAYTEDAVLCLTSWMSPGDVSAGCAAALPAKEEAVVQELDEATLLKRAKRKRAREKAAEEVRQLNEKNSGKAPPKKKKRKKKPPTGNMYEDL